MDEVYATVDRLSAVFTTTEQRLAITVAAIGFLFVVLLSSNTLQRQLDARTKTLYADVITTIVLVGTFVLTVAVSLGVWGQSSQLGEVTSQLPGEEAVVIQTIVSLVVVASTYILIRFVRRVLRDILTSAQAVTDHQREIAHRTAQVVLWATASIVILGVWQVDLGGILIGAGFLGIVLGMAARRTIGSMIAGFVLMFARPFEIGDWVRIGEDEGVVTDISIVNTRLLSAAGEYVMVPNDVVGSTTVVNRSRRGRLREEVEVGVDYEADVDRASERATAAASSVDEVLSTPEPQVVAKAFGDSAILLGVRFWIDEPTAPRLTRARTAVVRAVKEALDEEGIKIPYPQREVSGRAETGGFRLAPARDEAMQITSDESTRDTPPMGDGGRSKDGDGSGPKDADGSASRDGDETAVDAADPDRTEQDGGAS